MKAKEIQKELEENQIDESEAYELALSALIKCESQNTVLLAFAEWLKEHEFVVTMNTPEILVATFEKQLKKLKK